MNVYIGGVNGVGKSTILRRATGLDNRFEVIHWSSALMQQLGLAPDDYEGFHKCSRRQCNAATKSLMNNLIDRQTNRIRLIDGHILAINDIGTYRLAGDWVGRLDGIALITARPEVVWQRMSASERNNSRRVFPEGLTPEEQQQQLATNVNATAVEFDRWAKHYQVPKLIIEHNDDNADRSARHLLAFVNSLT